MDFDKSGYLSFNNKATGAPLYNITIYLEGKKIHLTDLFKYLVRL